MLALVGCGPEDVGVSSSSSREHPLIFGGACTDEVAGAAVGLLVDARVNFGDGLQDLETLLCSGVRVAPDVVLTAAHCVELEAQGATYVESAAFSVSARADLRGVFEQTAPFPEDRVAVREVHVPDAFDAASFLEASGLSSESDIAVLVLDGTLAGPDVYVAMPGEVALTPPAEVDLVGYGSTDPAGAVTGAVGQRRCVASFVSQLASDEMRVGLGQNSGRRCVVDSGGPTFAALGEGQRVVGLGSRAWDVETGCSAGHVETRLDVWWSYVDGVMRDACTRGVRSACAAPGLPRPPASDAGPDAGDASALDGAVLDGAMLDGSTLDGSNGDGPRDASVDDASGFDASTLDASTPDASILDASIPDASILDASILDASILDASGSDASLLDGGAERDAAPDDGSPETCTCAEASPSDGTPASGAPWLGLLSLLLVRPRAAPARPAHEGQHAEQGEA